MHQGDRRYLHSEIAADPAQGSSAVAGRMSSASAPSRAQLAMSAPGRLADGPLGSPGPGSSLIPPSFPMGNCRNRRESWDQSARRGASMDNYQFYLLDRQ